MRANSLETILMLGIVNGMRRRGRQRTVWLDIIKADMDKEAVKDNGECWELL